MDERISRTLARLNAASEMERANPGSVPFDERMISITEDTGAFFNAILRAMSAKYVLEIGMATGFSTIWMAEAVMGRNGRITTIDMNPKMVDVARRNFEEAGVAGVIDVIHGKASDVLAKMRSSGRYDSFFDFVLIDADKENIPRYFEEVLHMTRTGGMVSIDNMIHPRKYADMMAKVRVLVRQHPTVRSVLVPIGQGEMVAVKL